MANKENNKSYESIRTKLRKLQALAERGEAGEAMNARKAIERMCKQYDIELEDLYDFITLHNYTFKLDGEDEQLLFLLCAHSTGAIEDLVCTMIKENGIEVRLTALDYAELKSLYEWHKSNYMSELADMKRAFFLAYMDKHNLHFKGAAFDNTEIPEITDEDRRIYAKADILLKTMSNNTYHKQLEGKQ